MSQPLAAYNKLMIRIGEITLKKGNRGLFERRLIANIRRRIESKGAFDIRLIQSRLYVSPLDDGIDLGEIIPLVLPIFGVVSVSPVLAFDGSYEDLQEQARLLVGQHLQAHPHTTFKVETRRADKRFKHPSPEVNARLGKVLLDAFPDRLSVDVHQPDFVLAVEIRDGFSLTTQRFPGRGGLPVGTGGRGLLLLSGGLDSPVAGYLMASRGVELEAVYFHAFPYTSDRARDKVLRLADRLSAYTGRLVVHVVNFTTAQLALRDHVPHELLTVATRRLMMRLAEEIAADRSCRVLITGDSLGQVASQTMEAICAIDAVTSIPVFRPLIGQSKEETIRLARDIDTYETSIEPYEDCCTVFVSKHPKTRPSLAEAEAAEDGLDLDALISQTLSDIEVVTR